MSLEKFLSEKRSILIKKWRDALIESYPEDTRRFLRREKDSFSNPVGHIISKEIEALYDELVGGRDMEKMSCSLDNIIRVRAVQDFKPSTAVAFVLQLKPLVREQLEGLASRNSISVEIRDFEKRIDDMALVAFDVYSKCRQKIFELRVKEVKRQVERLLKRANILYEIPELDEKSRK